MKVLQVLYSGLGGHGSVVFSMIEADRNKHWEHVLIFYGVENLKPEYEARCIAKGIPYYFVQKQKKIDSKAFNAILKVIHQERPDKILLHCTTLAPYFLFAKSSIRSQTIMIEHTPNSHKAKFEWLSSIAGMQLFSKVVYLTTEYRKEMKQTLKFFFRQAKVCIISNGIDTDFFSPGEADKTSKTEAIISMVGRFSFTKDQKTLLDAFLHVISECSDKKMKLVLAGDGETRQILADKISRLKANHLCVLPGILNETEVRDLLRQTTIYVHSTISETMSTSIMQAMACGLPVIVTKIDGTMNMIRDGKDGLFVPLGNIDALSEAIKGLLRNSPKAEELGANARQHAIDCFSQEKMFMAYNQLVKLAGE